MHIERLGKDHRIGALGCRVTALNDWLFRHALKHEQRDLLRMWVLLFATSAMSWA